MPNDTHNADSIVKAIATLVAENAEYMPDILERVQAKDPETYPLDTRRPVAGPHDSVQVVINDNHGNLYTLLVSPLRPAGAEPAGAQYNSGFGTVAQIVDDRLLLHCEPGRPAVFELSDIYSVRSTPHPPGHRTVILSVTGCQISPEIRFRRPKDAREFASDLQQAVDRVKAGDTDAT